MEEECLRETKEKEDAAVKSQQKDAEICSLQEEKKKMETELLTEKHLIFLC